MKAKESKRFEILYDHHLKKLKLQGISKATINAYSKAVRRISEHFDCCPDKRTVEQLEDYSTRLVENYSWSTVKLDILRLMFFWKHVLEQYWKWLNIVKPPSVKTIPDILTREGVALLVHATAEIAVPSVLFRYVFNGSPPAGDHHPTGWRYRFWPEACPYPPRQGA